MLLSLLLNSSFSGVLPRIILLILSIFIASSSGAKPFERSSPEEEGMSSVQLQRLSQLASKYVAEGRVPGIVNLVMRNGEIVHFEAVGSRGVGDDSPASGRSVPHLLYDKAYNVCGSDAAMRRVNFALGSCHKICPRIERFEWLNKDGTLSPVEREMTMHQLLMHTAGFSYGFHAHRDPWINCMLPLTL